jgi:hypothetical protein
MDIQKLNDLLEAARNPYDAPRMKDAQKQLENNKEEILKQFNSLFGIVEKSDL